MAVLRPGTDGQQTRLKRPTCGSMNLQTLRATPEGSAGYRHGDTTRRMRMPPDRLTTGHGAHSPKRPPHQLAGSARWTDRQRADHGPAEGQRTRHRCSDHDDLPASRVAGDLSGGGRGVVGGAPMVGGLQMWAAAAAAGVIDVDAVV